MRGYEIREGGRQTFASAPTAPTAPVQTRAASTGVSAGAQVVGGQSQGGVVGADITTPGPIGGDLGEFFGKIMEPHIQRRQQEATLKGFIDQSMRTGQSEIKASNGAFSTIFGPTSYEEGAVMYTAQRAGREMASEFQSRSDELKQLAPDDLQRVVSGAMRDKMTGNAFTDNLLMTNMLESVQPVIETIAKQRTVWQQERAVSLASEASDAGAALLQSVAENNAALSSESDGDTATLSTARSSFLSSLQKPVGMTDESYKAFLHGTLMTAMQQGNFHAVRALRAAGIDTVFTEDERVKLEDAYHRYADDKVSAALTQPGLMGEYLKLVADEADPPPGMKPTDLVARKLKFNEAVKRATGVDEDLFDHKAVASGVTGMVNALASERRRQEDHRWTVEAREADRAADAAEFDRREGLKVAKVTAAFLAGQSAKGLLSGFGERDDYEIQANNAYQAGNLGTLVSNYRGGMTFNGVKNDMQRQLDVAVGGQYGQSVEKAYHDWKVLNAANPGAAMAYFEKYDGPMRNFHEAIIAEVPPAVAFQRAFQDPSRYGGAAIPAGRSKEAKEGVDAALSSQSAWNITRPLTGKPTNLNASSQRALRGYIEGRLGNLMQNSTASAKQLSAEILQNGIATGAVERYGQFVIINPPQTPRLSAMMNLQDDEATSIITKIIDRRLRAAGYSGGAGGSDYEITRYVDEHGKAAVSVLASDDNGYHSAVVRAHELQAAASAFVKASRAQTGKPYKGVNPYRRIPGESTAARLARINQEIKGGSDPIYHSKRK